MGIAENNNPVRVWENRFQTILLSICTAAVLGLFGFLWTMNKDFGAMEERDRQRVITEKDFSDELKALRKDFNEMNERVIRIESDRLYNEAQKRIDKPIR